MFEPVLSAQRALNTCVEGTSLSQQRTDLRLSDLRIDVFEGKTVENLRAVVLPADVVLVQSAPPTQALRE